MFAFYAFNAENVSIYCSLFKDYNVQNVHPNTFWPWGSR